MMSDEVAVHIPKILPVAGTNPCHDTAQLLTASCTAMYDLERLTASGQTCHMIRD